MTLPANLREQLERVFDGVVSDVLGSSASGEWRLEARFKDGRCLRADAAREKIPASELERTPARAVPD